ncbi:MAG: hypothetical protein QW688_07165 [Thermoprotei archaeon]
MDEVTFVNEWWRALKSRIDNGSLSRDVVTVSGSAGIELVKGRKAFLGRRGKVVDITLTPLRFSS